MLTWVQRVAGDPGPLQSLGQFMGEQNVAQLTVRVNLESPHERCPCPQSFVRAQAVKVHVSKVVRQRRHVHYPAGSALLQPIQQQVGQQEVTEMVDAKHEPKSIPCSAMRKDTYGQDGGATLVVFLIL